MTDTEPLPLTLYQLCDSGLRWAPAPSQRDWMNHISANRCLPLRVANQSGWHLLNNRRVRARWHGSDDPAAIEIEYADPTVLDNAAHAHSQRVGAVEHQAAFPVSHFGSGIISWYCNFVVRTQPGYNLLVRGPANHPKDGISALEGIIETDWATTTFTANWKFTRPGKTVTFEEGEPIAMIVPQRRGELERFQPSVKPISSDPELAAQFSAWNAQRNANQVDPDARDGGYMRGVGCPAGQHQTRIKLQEVTTE